MSFRTRLTTFFVLIVLLPMLAVGAIVFRLLDDTGRAKAGARANGLLAAAASVYRSDMIQADAAARATALRVIALPRGQLVSRLREVERRTGLLRIEVRQDGRVLADVGSPLAIAPGIAEVDSGTRRTTVAVSDTSASSFVQAVGSGNGLVLRERRRFLSGVPAGVARTPVPNSGQTTLHGITYQADSTRVAGFDGPLTITALSSLGAAESALGRSRLLAGVFIVGILLLACSFALLASRGVERQMSRFLRAAQRLGGGDFSEPVPVEGRDEFAMLAVEFNRMSAELATRLEQLRDERARLRESIHRAGQALASTLDRGALLALTLETTIDAVEAQAGRATVRESSTGSLVESASFGELEAARAAMLSAERQALAAGDIRTTSGEDIHVVSLPLGRTDPGERLHGLITVMRRTPFSAEDLDLLCSLVGQARLALENVALHEEVARQAVTDELTGLANHRRFQELLETELEQVRRYHTQLGLIMLDIDDFKEINDTYGHQQGDLVLRRVGHVLRATSRDADFAARYGGEEMALILPHTDLEGSRSIAERTRFALEQMHIPRLDGEGVLRVTASFGVATTVDGDREALIGKADAALYEAKRRGKNRCVTAVADPAGLASGE